MVSPSPKDIISFCDDYDSEILLADGFEEAFLGVGSTFNDEPIAIYDKHKCLDLLIKDFKRENQGSDTDYYEQALEYFYYDILGSYVGEKAPIFLDPFII